uniref:WW domain-containing protein n=1 Tax=Haptolina brevifila TaxID=156173 RepID=A0A7S2FY33_9EUKA|eukprot:CAMPEP_0174706340 /NCGR_PEP_ID=MMETSP1094-20130205/9227_1 /TAXON_ID=156173 /ORGANISM="Chrysochromulina brevifilum, Strain UTEX LB 985" /LENGTH=516 /DNA_ID=CAMNT_0015904595 /DNA_START=165 /DNA_END=1718 /DNA_ORIENTATION=+
MPDLWLPPPPTRAKLLLVSITGGLANLMVIVTVPLIAQQIVPIIVPEHAASTVMIASALFVIGNFFTLVLGDLADRLRDYSRPLGIVNWTMFASILMLIGFTYVPVSYALPLLYAAMILLGFAANGASNLLMALMGVWGALYPEHASRFAATGSLAIMLTSLLGYSLLGVLPISEDHLEALYVLLSLVMLQEIMRLCGVSAYYLRPMALLPRDPADPDEDDATMGRTTGSQRLNEQAGAAEAAGWQVGQTEGGKTFYYNKKLNVTQWKPPFGWRGAQSSSFCSVLCQATRTFGETLCDWTSPAYQAMRYFLCGIAFANVIPVGVSFITKYFLEDVVLLTEKEANALLPSIGGVATLLSMIFVIPVGRTSAGLKYPFTMILIWQVIVTALNPTIFLGQLKYWLVLPAIVSNGVGYSVLGVLMIPAALSAAAKTDTLSRDITFMFASSGLITAVVQLSLSRVFELVGADEVEGRRRPRYHIKGYYVVIGLFTLSGVLCVVSYAISAYVVKRRKGRELG